MGRRHPSSSLSRAAGEVGRVNLWGQIYDHYTTRHWSLKILRGDLGAAHFGMIGDTISLLDVRFGEISVSCLVGRDEGPRGSQIREGPIRLARRHERFTGLR